MFLNHPDDIEVGDLLIHKGETIVYVLRKEDDERLLDLNDEEDDDAWIVIRYAKDGFEDGMYFSELLELTANDPNWKHVPK